MALKLPNYDTQIALLSQASDIIQDTINLTHNHIHKGKLYAVQDILGAHRHRLLALDADTTSPDTFDFIANKV